MACLIMLSIMFFRIPVPFTQGFVHPGDGLIFFAVMVLGMKYAIPAAAIGASAANIIVGYPFWAPWTFVIKGGMALIMGLYVSKIQKFRTIGMVLAGLWMTAGYCVAGRVIYGNWAVALIGVPWDIGQFTVGIVIAKALYAALLKTPVGKRLF